jgi:putative transposase
MDNHYHLILELRELNLSRAVQWLNLSYSVWFNRRHGRSGHLFQGRFKSVVVDPLGWGLALSRYVHLNPVRVGRFGLDKSAQVRSRAGLSEAPDIEQVRERLQTLRAYRWSSYRAYLELGRQPEWLECATVLSLGGGKKGRERRAYREYVELAIREGLRKSPWEEVKEQVVLGGIEFLGELRQHISGDGREQRRAKRLAAERPGLEAVIACVEQVKGKKWDEFKERYGDSGRDLVLYLGRKVCGLKLRELAERIGLKDYAVVAMGVRRYEARSKGLGKDRKELQQIT